MVVGLKNWISVFMHVYGHAHARVYDISDWWQLKNVAYQ